MKSLLKVCCNHLFLNERSKHDDLYKGLCTVYNPVKLTHIVTLVVKIQHHPRFAWALKYTIVLKTYGLHVYKLIIL